MVIRLRAFPRPTDPIISKNHPELPAPKPSGESLNSCSKANPGLKIGKTELAT
jgi:hypothetical protein